MIPVDDPNADEELNDHPTEEAPTEGSVGDANMIDGGDSTIYKKGVINKGKPLVIGELYGVKN